jgi:coenzyme F420-reducing hydrogenase beta subunit
VIEVSDKQLCNGCGVCKNKCPKGCIALKLDEKGFRYPDVDQKECIGCHICENVCPMKNEMLRGQKTVAYAMYNTDISVRLRSSSGGIFSLISEWVLNNDGIIIGAAYTERNKVEHLATENDYSIFCGSKYLQSHINNAYIIAKSELEKGRYVFFTGTPCQIAGAKAYIGKDYDKFITQDIACHGVPSELIWVKYIDYLECKYKSDIKTINLRDKTSGWKGYSVRIDFANGKSYVKRRDEDPFMKLYLSNLCLRPSCYNCRFRCIDRNSDITLADFWGIDQIMPEIDDDKGLSLVLVHSPRGEKILKAVKDKIEYKRIDINKAVSGNPAIFASIKEPEKSREFWQDLEKLDIKKLEHKYCRKPLTMYDVKVRIARMIK